MIINNITLYSILQNVTNKQFFKEKDQQLRSPAIPLGYPSVMLTCGYDSTKPWPW